MKNVNLQKIYSLQKKTKVKFGFSAPKLGENNCC